jgi:DNA-directed RNA polymerase subunit K/omega
MSSNNSNNSNNSNKLSSENNNIKYGSSESVKSISKKNKDKKTVINVKNNNNEEVNENNYDTITEDYRMLLMNYNPKKNITRPLMSKYEKALILGKRATMIANGAEPLVDVEEGETDIIKIAEEELNKKLTPFIIERNLGNGKKELWKIKDMIINLD